MTFENCYKQPLAGLRREVEATVRSEGDPGGAAVSHLPYATGLKSHWGRKGPQNGKKECWASHVQVS